MTKLAPFSLLFTSTIVFAARSKPQPQCGHGFPHNPLSHPGPICVNDEVNTDIAEAWTPWTHKPYCITAADGPWCVYTNAAVAGKHGLSIITTPEISESLNLLEGHDLDKSFPVTASKSFPERPYEVRDVPGKGKGAIATQRIEKDRVILIDYAMVMATVEYPSDVTKEEVRDMLTRGVEQLPEPGRVFELSRKGRPTDNDEGDGENGEGVSEVEDLLFSNSFAVTVGGHQFMTLFPDLAVSTFGG